MSDECKSWDYLRDKLVPRDVLKPYLHALEDPGKLAAYDQSVAAMMDSIRSTGIDTGDKESKAAFLIGLSIGLTAEEDDVREVLMFTTHLLAWHWDDE